MNPLAKDVLKIGSNPFQGEHFHSLVSVVFGQPQKLGQAPRSFNPGELNP